jgi:hypothetical protein
MFFHFLVETIHIDKQPAFEDEIWDITTDLNEDNCE